MRATAGSHRGESSPASEESAASVEQLPPTRVLLIEDEPGIVDFVRRGLEAQGFDVEAEIGRAHV